jgi:thiamine pyrophosphate-dependent acetolactate synthase large subunit-like protein
MNKVQHDAAHGMSGKVGVAIATSGPGNRHRNCDAQIDSTPWFVYYRASLKTSLGSDAFQELIILGFLTTVTKWNAKPQRHRDSENHTKCFLHSKTRSRTSVS